MTRYGQRPGRRRRAGWRPALLALLASIAVIGALGGCSAGRGVLGTSTSPCFIALPLAKHAVHGRGSWTGVRIVDPATLTRNEQGLHRLLDRLHVRPGQNVCLVEYVGRFTPGQVERPIGPHLVGVARYAIAVVTTRKPRLLGTVLLRHEPLTFRHSHLGP
jgi:hypothetical protein